MRGWPARLAVEEAWLLQSDPSPTHSKCHRSKATWDKQKQVSSYRNPFLDQDTDSQHSRASWVCGKDLSMAVWWPSPDLPLLCPRNQINRGSCLTLSIHKLLSSSRSPPRGWWVLLGSSLRSARCTFSPGQVSLGGSSLRNSAAHTRETTPPLFLLPPAHLSSTSSFPPLWVCSSLFCHHIFFSSGPLPSPSEWCGLWKALAWALEAFHDRPKAFLLASP